MSLRHKRVLRPYVDAIAIVGLVAEARRVAVRRLAIKHRRDIQEHYAYSRLVPAARRSLP